MNNLRVRNWVLFTAGLLLAGLLINSVSAEEPTTTTWRKLENSFFLENDLVRAEFNIKRNYHLKGFFLKEKPILKLSGGWLEEEGGLGSCKWEEPEIIEGKGFTQVSINQKWPSFEVKKTIKITEGKPYIYIRYDLKATKDFEGVFNLWDDHGNSQQVLWGRTKFERWKEWNDWETKKHGFPIKGFSEKSWVLFFDKNNKVTGGSYIPSLANWERFGVWCFSNPGPGGGSYSLRFQKLIKASPGDTFTLDLYRLGFTAENPEEAKTKIREIISGIKGKAIAFKGNGNYLECPKLSSAPTIDGHVTEDAWKEATEVGSFPKRQGGIGIDYGTSALLGYTDKHFYLAFLCKKPTEYKLRTKIEKRDGTVWEDDNINIFISSKSDASEYFQFITNPIGTRYDNRVIVPGAGLLEHHESWNSSWKTASSVTDNLWITEIEIPFKDLGCVPKQGDLWRVNLNNAGPHYQYSSWSPTFGSFERPEYFGWMRFGSYARFGGKPIRIKVESLGEEDGTYVARARLKNNSTQPLNLEARLDLLSIQSDKASFFSNYFKLNPKQEIILELPYRHLVNKREKNQLFFSLKDPFSGELIYQNLYTMTTVIGTNQVRAQVLEEAEGYQIWKTGSVVKIFPHDEVEVVKKGKVIELCAARREYEPFQLVISPRKGHDCTNLKLNFSDLIGKEGKISKENINIRRVGYVDCKVTSDSYGRLGLWPDPLPLYKPFTAEGGSNYPIWVTVYVPEETPAGTYQGEVELISSEASLFKGKLKVKVWNFTLPEYRQHLVRGLPPSPFGEAYRMRTITMPWGIPYRTPKMVGEDIFIPELEDPSMRARLEAGIEHVKKRGTPLMKMCGFHVGDAVHIRKFMGYEWQSEEYGEYLEKYLTKLYDFYSEKGMGDKLYFYLYDEPCTLETFSVMLKVARIVKKVSPKIKTSVLTSGTYYGGGTKELQGLVDIWGCIYNYMSPSLLESAKKGEKKVSPVINSLYPYPGLLIDNPAMTHRIMTWVNYKYNLYPIIFWWHTSSWNRPGANWKNPWKTPNVWPSLNGDGFVVYPEDENAKQYSRITKYIPSIRLELLRDGLEDYDYFWLLEKKLGQLEKSASKKDKEIREVITEGKKLLNLPDELIKSLKDYPKDQEDIYKARYKIGEMLDRIESLLKKF